MVWESVGDLRQAIACGDFESRMHRSKWFRLIEGRLYSAMGLPAHLAAIKETFPRNLRKIKQSAYQPSEHSNAGGYEKALTFLYGALLLGLGDLLSENTDADRECNLSHSIL